MYCFLTVEKGSFLLYFPSGCNYGYNYEKRGVTDDINEENKICFLGNFKKAVVRIQSSCLNGPFTSCHIS